MVRRIGDPAPCFVPLPTSSLSKMASTLVLLQGSESIRACSPACTIAKSSRRPEEINSLFNPSKVPFSYSYRVRSKSRISSQGICISSAINFSRKLSFSNFSLIMASTGSISFCLLRGFPCSFTVRLK